MTKDESSRWGRLLVEFTLIVAGVFALAVDGWASARSERESEIYYLRQLRQDIAESEGALRVNFVERLTAAREAGIEVLPYLRSGSDLGLDPEQLMVRIFHATRAYGDYSQAYIDAAYQSLKSTGDLRIIEDRELRDKVIAFYARGEQNGFLLATHPGEYSRLVRERLPWNVQQEIRKTCPVQQSPRSCRVDASPIDVTEFLSAMRNNQEVANALNLLLTRLAITIRVMEESRSQAQELLGDIDSKTAK